MIDSEFEAETLRRALAGDHEAGRNALDACVAKLYFGGDRLSPALSHYLADRLAEVLAGIEPRKALRIAKPNLKPKVPFPEWELPLAAFAALASKRRQPPEAILAKMSEARELLEGKLLSRTQAGRIRSTYKAMRSLSVRELKHLLLVKPTTSQNRLQAARLGEEAARDLVRTCYRRAY